MTFNLTERSKAAQLRWLLYKGDCTIRVSRSCIFTHSWYSYCKSLVLNNNFCNKVNRLLRLIRSFDHLDSSMLVKLFVTMVLPTLEYCNSIWGPSFILDQRKIEKVQCRATRLLPFFEDKPYEERLLILQLPSLAHRCYRGDLILLYKILNNYFSSDFSALYTYSTTTNLNCSSFNQDWTADPNIFLID